MYYTIGKKQDGSFVVNRFSGSYFILLYNSFGRNLPDQNSLETLEYVNNGQIFCNIDFTNQNTDRLETIYNGQIFYGAK